MLDAGIRSNLRSYFAFFMVFPLVCFATLFVNITSLPTFLPFTDVLLAFAGSLILPLFHIYFRLLTIDAKLSFSKHFPFLILPLLVALLYAVGVFVMPANEYRDYLNNKLSRTYSVHVQFLSAVQIVLWLHLIAQVAITFVWNHVLIRKYGGRAEQFYSEINNVNVFNANMLNYSILIVSISSIVSYLFVERHHVCVDEVIIALWSIFSFTLYVIGYIGFKQETLNPIIELETSNINSAVEWSNQSTIVQKKIIEKMILQFEGKKIFLNSKLNIMDVVQAVGTNRTYISAIINQHYNQHFCAFVNSYRLDEMGKIYLANPTISNEELAGLAGFGSVNSCTRALNAKTGLTLAEWRKQKRNHK